MAGSQKRSVSSQEGREETFGSATGISVDGGQAAVTKTFGGEEASLLNALRPRAKRRLKTVCHRKGQASALQDSPTRPLLSLCCPASENMTRGMRPRRHPRLRKDLFWDGSIARKCSAAGRYNGRCRTGNHSRHLRDPQRRGRP